MAHLVSERDWHQAAGLDTFSDLVGQRFGSRSALATWLRFFADDFGDAVLTVAEIANERG